MANAASYRATLPSLTADETIASESSYLGMFKNKVTAQGTFRALHAEAGAPLEESRQITLLNGKPVDPTKQVKLPATLFGGFGRFQEMFFTPVNRLCFGFTLLPEPGPGGTLQIAISVPAELQGQGLCTTQRNGLTGLALVDPTAHQLVHLERTVPDEIAQIGHLASFASVDCAPTRVGEDTFWLPTTVTGRILTGKVRGHFLAHYSNYHRYTAKITLLPGAPEVVPVPDSPPE